VVGVSGPRLIELPQRLDRRGNLTFVEGHNHAPFEVRRAYWIYEVPGGATRGGHGYRRLEEMFIALSGSFDVVYNDGEQQRTVSLNRSYLGLYVPALVWRQLDNFSTNAVCLILASRPYEPEDYLYDRDEWRKTRAESR
jgi:mannose-6-phosphate isomerase-like protein (cupin superfamily)